MVTMDDMNGEDPLDKLFDDNGLTAEKIVKKWKRLCNAKVTKTQKLKGAVTSSTLPKTVKIIAESGVVYIDDDGETRYGDGDTVIIWKEEDNRTRRDALRDVSTMRGYFKDKGENSDKILNIHLVDFDESNYSESEKHGKHISPE